MYSLKDFYLNPENVQNDDVASLNLIQQRYHHIMKTLKQFNVSQDLLENS